MSKNKGRGNDLFCKVYYNYLIKMRRVIILFIIFISSIFLACSNSQDSKLSYTDVDTIKEIVKDREVDVIWTKEVEGERLDKDISRYIEKKIGEDVPFTPSTIKILPSYKESVYPSIQTFGSLNSSNLPEEKRNYINDFCKSISDNIFSGPDGYFKASYMFNYVFFSNELVEKWPLMFEEDFPFTKEEMEKAVAAEKEKQQALEDEKNGIKKPDSKNDKKSEEEIKMPDPLFTRWILGEPFIGDDLLQLPVRFFTKNGSLDVTMYMSPKSENSVYQVTIDRWEKSNGRQ